MMSRRFTFVSVSRPAARDRAFQYLFLAGLVVVSTTISLTIVVALIR